MSFDVFSAFVLIACLICFFTLNVLNILIHHRHRSDRRYRKGEVSRPPEYPVFMLAAFGTIVFWIEVLLYPLLVLTGLFSEAKFSSLRINLPYNQFLRWIGLGLLVFGFFLFSWSVLSRGRYSVSWEMSEDHVLVTWGPYGIVRHPSYLSYFLMFCGLFLLQLNFLAAIPLLAIPGYVHMVKEEEKMLIERFGDDYLRYQERVGKFIPKLRKKKN